MAKSAEKTCLDCGAKIIGRADKKFCSDICRVSYNNKLNSNETNHMRNVNNTLRKNRRILMEANPTGKTKMSREKLIQRGFDFNHFTNIYKTKEGAIYYYCYEQGYLPIENNWYLLVERKENL